MVFHTYKLSLLTPKSYYVLIIFFEKMFCSRMKNLETIFYSVVYFIYTYIIVFKLLFELKTWLIIRLESFSKLFY